MPKRTDLDAPSGQTCSSKRKLVAALRSSKGPRMASGVRESALGSVESGRACIGRRVALRADSGGWRRQGHDLARRRLCMAAATFYYLHGSTCTTTLPPAEHHRTSGGQHLMHACMTAAGRRCDDCGEVVSSVPARHAWPGWRIVPSPCCGSTQLAAPKLMFTGIDRSKYMRRVRLELPSWLG